MQEELEQLRVESLSLCNRLLTLLEENREDAYSFFGGEVYQSYTDATEKAKNKAQKIRSKIRSL